MLLLVMNTTTISVFPNGFYSPMLPTISNLHIIWQTTIHLKPYDQNIWFNGNILLLDIILLKEIVSVIMNIYIIWHNKCLTYFSILMWKSDSQVWHRTQNGDKRLNGVAVYHWSILFKVFGSESTLMNNSENVKGMKTEMKKPPW